MCKKDKTRTLPKTSAENSSNSLKDQENPSKETVEYGIVTVLTVLLFLLVMGSLTGKGLFDSNPYNTYALQADAWRHGQLDLGRDYPWLELAIYEGKYYVSFPPFPSYLLFPFTFFFGSNTPDYLILLAVNLITAVFLYKTAVKMSVELGGAVIGTLFVLLGSNMVFLMIDPSVWFFAQTLSFSTAVLALSSAVSGNGAASLFFWACSVGCRPMQAVFLPVLLYVLYQREKERFPGENL